MPYRVLTFGRFRFDPESRTLYKDDRLVHLTSRSIEVLALLLERPGEVITKDEFLERVWKDTFVEQRNLTQCVFLLRKALDDVDSPSIIETVSKRGYRFIAPVQATERTPPQAAPRVSFPSPPLPPYRAFRRWGIVLIATCTIAAASYGVFQFLRLSPPSPPLSAMSRLTWSGFAHDPDISPDGRFAVFVAEDSSARYAVYRLDFSTSSTRPLAPPSADRVESPAISSDGAWVAYRSSLGDGQVLIVPSDGSRPPVPVPDSSRGRNPRWQPGRRALAYWVASDEHIRNIGIVNMKSVDPPGKPSRLFDGFDTATFPLWSPDGSAILGLGTLQSSIPEREFDAWVNPFINGAATETAIRTGLFDLLKSHRLYSTVRDRNRVSLTAWRGNYLYLSIHTGNSANLYRVRLGSDYKVSGVPEPLTSSANLLLAPRISSTGLLVFSSITLAQNPVRLSLDGASLEPLPLSQGWLSRFSLTDDGGRIVAEQYTPGEPVRIVSASPPSTASVLISSGSVAFPIITPDGKTVAWRSMDGRKQTIDSASASGGPVRRVCDDCGAPEEWTPDGSAILYHTGGVPARIGVLDARSGRSHDWIIHPDQSVFSPRLSVAPDGAGWVTFYAENTPRTRQVFIAPVNGFKTPPPASWIPITDGSAWDSSPVWSPKGNAIFFISQRDGHRCIYYVSLHPSSRRPLGAPLPLRHFHSYAQSLSLFNSNRGAENLRVADGSLFFILDDVSSNVWSLPLGVN